MSALSREEELALLIEEQEKDAAWGDRINYSREARLDAPVGGSEDGFSLGDMVGTKDQALAHVSGDVDTTIVRNIQVARWNRRSILKTIRAWAKEHGEPPTYNEWRRTNGRGIPSSHTVQQHFGTWSAAIAAAGFPARPVGGTSDGNRKRIRPRMRRQRNDALLTPEQVKAAYVIYDRQKLSVPQVADLLYAKYGYLSVRACQVALLRAFHADGYKMRTRSEAIKLRFTREELEERGRRLAADRWAA